MSQRERMVRGEPYDPRDPELVRARKQARALLAAYNATAGSVDLDERVRLLRRLLGRMGEGAWIEPPFQCDYGFNIALGRDVYMNFNCVILDVAPVSIGDHVLFGPGVQLYTAGHPLEAAERRSGMEWGKPIAIGDEAWIGGNGVVVPGVTIGARTVVGAGSVVTRDLPADVLAAGNPCRVLRPLQAR